MADMKSQLPVRKGAWTEEEDVLLKQCIEKYGEGRWYLVPIRAGLNRCRKSCRLRWVNYLRPNIKRGKFTSDEVDLMNRLHRLLGNRWSLIAARLPGRTSNDVKNFWNSHLRQKSSANNQCPTNNVIKPQARTLSRSFQWVNRRLLAESELTGQPSLERFVHKKQPMVPPARIEDEQLWSEDLSAENQIGSHYHHHRNVQSGSEEHEKAEAEATAIAGNKPGGHHYCDGGFAHDVSLWDWDDLYTTIIQESSLCR